MDVPFVLSVEDNDADFLLTETVLRECINPLELGRASDGDEAVAFLKRLVRSTETRHPDLVLLDVNLPRLDGLAVLKFMKSEEFICDIPVVTFSSSSTPHERKTALSLGAEQFITKPMDLANMLKVLNEVCAKYLKRSATPE